LVLRPFNGGAQLLGTEPDPLGGLDQVSADGEQLSGLAQRSLIAIALPFRVETLEFRDRAAPRGRARRPVLDALGRLCLLPATVLAVQLARLRSQATKSPLAQD